ncbi:MAG TPA: VOC family protein, partial [Kofleriaceae bacterium]|nr:VOC family protein [Kofleriaceae bacterium]
VDNLDRTLTFYTKAFGFKEKQRHGGYAELSTGAVTLAFAERDFVAGHTGMKLKKAAGGGEIALVVPLASVESQFDKAVKAGATSVVKPRAQPWGQTVSYVSDPDGHLIEICSPAD